MFNGCKMVVIMYIVMTRTLHELIIFMSFGYRVSDQAKYNSSH